MKAILVVLWVGLVSQQIGLAQPAESIRIKGGAEAEKAVPFNQRYRYNQFYEGKILYQNGTTAAARFNYNVLLGEMHFIGPGGDTLALSNEPLVQLVSIGPDTFWFDSAKGYLEIIAIYSPLKLAVKQGFRMAKRDKLGAYDQSSGTSAITNYQSIYSGSAPFRNLEQKGDLLLMRSRMYFVIDQNNRTYPMTKANVVKVFAKHRDQVTDYLTANPVDFTQEGDLKKLLEYCSKLP